MIFKIFPILHEILPSYVWIMAVVAVAIRIVAYIVAAIKYRKFSSLHTYLNKLTGFLVFLVPYLVKLKYGIVYCTFLCSMAILASLEELVLLLDGCVWVL